MSESSRSPSLPNTCGEADAIDRGSDLFGARLVWIEGRPRQAYIDGTHLHSLNTLKCSRDPANAAFAMHSFNRQCKQVLHHISPSMRIDAYTPQGYSTWFRFRFRKSSILRTVSTKHCIPRTTPIH